MAFWSKRSNGQTETSPTIGTVIAESFADVTISWLACKRRTDKESTYAQYVRALYKHILPFFKQTAVSTLTTGMLEDFILSLKGKGLAAKTVSDIVEMAKNILRYTDAPLACRLDKIKVRWESPKPHVLTTEQEKCLRRQLSNGGTDRIGMGILLCLSTGLRVGELCALRWEDIDLQGGVLHVRRTMQRIQDNSSGALTKTKIVVTSPKSGSGVRDIPIPQFFILLLKPYQAAPGVWFLSGEADKYIEPRTVQRRFQAVIKECGLPSVNLHCTRHTFATRWVETGGDAKCLSELLGHSNVSITLRRYVHPSVETKRKHMERLALTA